MRAKQCVMCHAPLPPGSRIDRRYCRESCRVMACRQRTKQAAASHARWLTTQTAANQTHQSLESATLPEQIAQAAEELAKAQRRVAELDARYRALVQQRNATERQDETAQRPPAAQESKIPPVRQDEETTTPKPSAVQIVTPGSEREHPAQELVPLAEPLPWMVPSPDEPSALVPKWTLLRADILTGIDDKIDRELLRLPEILSQGGRDDLANQVRSAFNNGFPLVRQIAKSLALRLVCTKGSDRESPDQIGKIVALAVDDLTKPQWYKDSAERDESVQFISGNAAAIWYLSIFLIRLLKDFEDLIEMNAAKSGLNLVTRLR